MGEINPGRSCRAETGDDSPEDATQTRGERGVFDTDGVGDLERREVCMNA